MGRALVALGTGHVKRVHLSPRGVVAGDVQRVEVVPIGVDARAFGDRETHLGKDRSQLFGDLADRVDAALTLVPRGQGHVEPFAAQTLIKRGIAKCCLLGGKRRVDFILQRVQRRPGDLSLFGGHLAQLAHLQRDLALLADGSQPDVFQCGFVTGIGDLAQVLLLQIVHDRPLE